MSPTTPIYALPYPAATDPADVPLDMQELADRIEAVLPLLRQPHCRITNTTLQAGLAAAGAWSTISFNTEVADTDNMWVVGTPTTVTIRTAGLYVASGGFQLDSSVGGYRRYAAIRRNNVEIGSAGQGGMAHVDSPGVDDPKLAVTAIYPCQVNDTITLHVYHDMASARNIAADAYLAVARLSAL